MHLYLPQYASPRNPKGIIPPSPPAEWEAARSRIVACELRYPVSGRVLLPGMRFYDETMQAIRIGTPGAMNGGMQSLTGIETQLLGSSGGIASLQDAAFYYKLDDTSWLDSTANHNNLTSNGSPPNVTGPTGTGNGVSFTTSGSPNQRLTHADATAFDMSGTDFSFYMWVWIPTGSTGTFFDKSTGTAATSDWNCQYDGTGINFLCWQASGFLNPYWTGFGAGDKDKWNCFFFKHKSGHTEIWMNNAVKNDDTTAGTMHHTTTQVTLGARNGGSGGYMTVRLDEVGGWKRYTTTIEDAAYYNSGSGKSVF